MKRKKIILILVILVILFILGFAGLVVYTERPEFCPSCHIMKPYYDAWKESPHKHVNCLECHYQPNWSSHFKGKIDGLVQIIDYITGRYSERMVAKIKDTSCLREGCHTKQKIIDTKIMFKDKVRFRHQTHWKDFDELGKEVYLRCTTCHMWLTYDKHISVDQDTCFICHFKNVSVDEISKQCTSCHTETAKIPEHSEYAAQGMKCNECHTTIKTTNAPVIKQMCYFCHADKNKLDKAGDRELMHTRHIPQNNAKCINCHQMIKHGKDS